MRACVTLAVDQLALLMLLVLTAVPVLIRVHATASLYGDAGRARAFAGPQADRSP